MGFNNLVLLTIGLVLSCQLAHCAQNDSREEFSSKEKTALEKFRKEIKAIKYLDYHDQGIWLIHWLRDQNLDIQKAKNKLVKSLEWRKENQIDTIRENPEMKSLEKHLPVTIGKYFDKFGRPSFHITFSKWAIRAFTLKGKRAAVNRYCVYVFERVLKVARDAGKAHFIWIVDMNGYNLRDQGCLACLPLYTQLVTEYENHFPNMARHIMLVNTPRIFETVLNLIRPIMSIYTKMDLEVLGLDQLEWKSRMLELFDAGAIPPSLGGTGPVLA